MSITEFFSDFERVKHRGHISHQVHNYEGFYLDMEYSVAWYNKIHNSRNHNNTAKLVEVVFENQKYQRNFKIKLPLEVIPKFPIGSIWKNGKSSEKYAFETMDIKIEEGHENLYFDSNFKTNNEGRGYLIDPEIYRVNSIGQDKNECLIVNLNEQQKVIIHPLIFFNAHYGASKEINRILLTYNWNKVIERFGFLYNGVQNHQVAIPPRLVIADATFLYHLKNDEYSSQVIRDFHGEMARRFREAPPRNGENLGIDPVGTASFFARPFHNQSIDMRINYIELDENTFLCSEILGMSLPLGDAIEYIIPIGNEFNNNGLLDGNDAFMFRPLYHIFDSEEVILDAGVNPRNGNVALIKHRIENIGQLRELVERNQIDLAEAINRCNKVITLPEDIPDIFAVGTPEGFDGDVGQLLVVLEQANEISLQESNFERLLRYAQKLKVDSKYYPLAVECYCNRQLIGEVVKPMTSSQINSNVQSVYVLKLNTNSQNYYIFDCNMCGVTQTSGVIIQFSSFEVHENIRKVLTELFHNSGRLSREFYESNNDIRYLAFFKHTSGEDVNWCRTALQKINGK